jgi:4-amino-4-deoxy-L-arabinose transferase-like glycosyltransferase
VRVNNSKRSLFERDPRSIALVVLAVGLLLRFVLAASVGLGVDESYAVAIARQWSWSYFDHPPLHFWLAGGIAKLAASEAGAVVRLPFVLCFAGTTWLTYRIGTRFFGERAGALAAVILNVSAVFSLSTGGWVLPDGPLMLLMLAAVYVISGILFEEQRNSGPLGGWPVTARWLAAGFITGLAMLAKYHGIFILAGTFLFLLTSAPHRKWLGHPGPYLGAVIAFACFTPVLYWNSEHHWVSFAFQGGRATGQGIHLPTVLTNIAGQAAWVLPWIWVPLVGVLWSAIRGGPRDTSRWFFVCLGIGPIAAFTLVALHGDVGLPHWQAPGYLMIFPVLGAAVAARIERRDRVAQRWLLASVVGYVALVLILVTHAATGWMARALPSAFAKGDPSGDLRTWRELRPALDSLGLLTADMFVAAPSWIQAGEASVALGPDVPVLCLCADPHHFYYLRDDRAFLGRDALIVKKLKPGDNVPATFAPYFDSVEAIAMVPVLRDHRALFDIGVYRARHFRALFPTAQPR